MSRIDFFLTPLYNLGWVKSCEILPSFMSDHSFVSLEIEPEKIIRGKGYWKLNNSLLYNKSYLENMSKKLEVEIKDHEEGKREEQVWENLKYVAQTYSIRFSKDLHQERHEKLGKLERQLRTQNKRLGMINLTAENAVSLINKVNEKIDKIKVEMDEIYRYRAQGAILRSKVNWINEGEKNMAYFYNLEKSRARNKTMTATKLHTGEVVHKNELILKEQKKFFSKLYTKDESVSFKYKNEQAPKLSAELREMRCRDNNGGSISCFEGNEKR